MPLSKKQLGLIFAKLREKGLLKYIKKGRGTRLMAGTSSLARGLTAPKARSESPVPTEILDSIFNKETPKKLLSRLPKEHQRLTMMTGVKIWDSEVLGKKGRVGAYEIFTGKLHVSRSPVEYAFPKGYDRVRPLHVPRGSLLSHRRYERNAKLGAAKSFYHEFGHSLWNRLTPQQKRSFPAMGEWEGVMREEAFSDAYSAYATNKFSKTRLKKEKPFTYEFMRRFFEGSL